MPTKKQQVASTSSEAAEANAGTAPTVLDENTAKELVEMIHFVAAAKDAMSDDMVSRIAGVASESMMMVDRLTRNDALMRLVRTLDSPDCQRLLNGLADALAKTSRELADAEASKGGAGELWRLAREPGTQDGIRTLAVFSQHLNESMRRQ